MTDLSPILASTPGDAKAIIDVSRESTTPHHVEAGSLYVVQGAYGHTVVDLTGDQYREYPERKHGTVNVRDVASLALYYGKHSDVDSEVFTDLDAATITAVLDAHGNDARWQAHRAVLTMERTPQWVTWTGKNKIKMTQQAFAEFIEDNAPDIAPGGPCTAADLLELAQQFQAHTRVSFSSAKRLKDGQTQLTYAETIEAKAGERGTIEIPDAFELAVAPFEDCAPYRVKARFRYRLNGGDLAMFYQLNDPDTVFRHAVLDVVAKAEEACKTIIMRGRPA